MKQLLKIVGAVFQRLEMIVSEITFSNKGITGRTSIITGGKIAAIPAWSRLVPSVNSPYGKNVIRADYILDIVDACILGPGNLVEYRCFHHGCSQAIF